MPKLIAVVTAGIDTTEKQLAAYLRHVFDPRVQHGRTADSDRVTITHLEIRHPDGEHYRDKATGEFASAEDEAERPDEITHETGDHRPAHEAGDRPDES